MTAALSQDAAGRASGGRAAPCEPLVSIVTPFYNTHKYLRECMESVIHQTYNNWEYILIDNSSTDGSSEIAQEYAQKDPQRIRIVRTQALLPQVENYNLAMRSISAESKYCKMVQADDWIFPECVRSMTGVAEAHPGVGIVAAYELEGEKVRLDGLPYPSPEIAGRQAARIYFIEGTYLFGTPTSLLYRSDLVRAREPFFDARFTPFEDGHLCFELLRQSNFGFVHQVLTYTRRDNSSIMSRVHAFGMEVFVRFSLLAAHGRDFLSEEEYRSCLKKAERAYFTFLARCAVARRRKHEEFWEFHRAGMASVGYELSEKTLAKWMPRAMLEKSWEWFWRTMDRESAPLFRSDTETGSVGAAAAHEPDRSDAARFSQAGGAIEQSHLKSGENRPRACY